MNGAMESRRHNRIMEKITNAQTIEELPKIGYDNILTFLVNNAYFDKRKLKKSDFKDLLDIIKKWGTFSHPCVLNTFFETMKSNYSYLLNYPSYLSETKILDLYNKLNRTNRVNYILDEMRVRDLKAAVLTYYINLANHKKIMNQIRNARSIEDLPNVGIDDLNNEILEAINSNSYKAGFKAEDVMEIASARLNGADLFDLLSKFVWLNITKTYHEKALDEIFKKIYDPYKTLSLKVTEIRANEKKKLELCKRELLSSQPESDANKQLKKKL